MYLITPGEKSPLTTPLLQSTFVCLCLKFYMLSTSRNKFENISSYRIFRQKSTIFGDHFKIVSLVVCYVLCILWNFIKLSHYMNTMYDISLSVTLIHMDTYIQWNMLRKKCCDCEIISVSFRYARALKYRLGWARSTLYCFSYALKRVACCCYR